MLSDTQLEKYYQQYGKDKVNAALEYLTYYHPDPLPKQESTTQPTIYIFRHGQSEDNQEFLFSGWRDSAITEKGIEQALILAEKLKTKKIDMLISSTQKRAIETMKHAISLNKQAKNLEIHTEEKIKERSYGDLQGTSKLELYLKDPAYTEQIRRGYDVVPPNGESLQMVCARVAKFCEEIIPLIKETKINAAISCHGNSIRGFRQYFEELSNEETAVIETPLGQDYAAYVIS